MAVQLEAVQLVAVQLHVLLLVLQMLLTPMLLMLAVHTHAPVGDVGAPLPALGVCERRNHIAQRRQRLVDLLALLQPPASGT